MLLFANVQSQDDTTDDADVNLLEGLADTETVLNNDAVEILDDLGKFSKLNSRTIAWKSHNRLLIIMVKLQPL